MNVLSFFLGVLVGLFLAGVAVFAAIRSMMTGDEAEDSFAPRTSTPNLEMDHGDHCLSDSVR